MPKCEFHDYLLMEKIMGHNAYCCPKAENCPYKKGFILDLEGEFPICRTGGKVNKKGLFTIVSSNS